MKTKIFAFWILLFLSLNVFAKDAAAARQAVKSFYKFHFSRDYAFTKDEIEKRTRFFTNEFYQLLIDEWEREFDIRHPKDTDSRLVMKPTFDALPFQPGGELYPHYHCIEKISIRGIRANVEVKFFYDKKCRGIFIAKHTIELIKFKGKWSINDVIEDNGERLSEELKRLKAAKS